MTNAYNVESEYACFWHQDLPMSEYNKSIEDLKKQLKKTDSIEKRKSIEKEIGYMKRDLKRIWNENH